MDSRSILTGDAQSRRVLALARGRSGIRRLQKRHPRFLSERIECVWSPSYRPTSVCAAGDARKRCVRSRNYGWNGSRVFLRNRAMEQVPNQSQNMAQKASRTNHYRMADRRTRKELVRSVQTISGRRETSDCASQLPGMCTLQREAECVQRRRLLAQNQQSRIVLFRRRSEFIRARRIVRTFHVFYWPSVGMAICILLRINPFL